MPSLDGGSYSGGQWRLLELKKSLMALAVQLTELGEAATAYT